MRIGVLGGTFDPIHLGHLIIAEETRDRLDLEEVCFVPARDPWMKAGQPLTSGHDRLSMARLAVEDNPFFQVSTLELERPGPSYTVDTLRELQKEYGPEAQLFFILDRTPSSGSTSGRTLRAYLGWLHWWWWIGREQRLQRRL